MSRKLSRDFFVRATLKVASGLLGCYVVRKMGRRTIRVRITETEAYVGTQDKANHASRGRTARTEVMFGEPGHLYIYLIYGMYYCLNVVTEKAGYPAAVLIRAVAASSKSDDFFRPLGQKKQNQAAIVIKGPGRVCRYLAIDRRLNGVDVTASRTIWFEKGKLHKNEKIVAGKRIGVDYAGHWQHKFWRFYIKNKLSYRTIN